MAKAKSQEFVYDSGASGTKLISEYTKKDVIKLENIYLDSLTYTKDGNNLLIKSGVFTINIANYFVSKSKLDTLIAQDSSGNEKTIKISQEANIHYTSLERNETFNFGKGIGTITFDGYTGTGFGKDTVILNKGETVYLDFQNNQNLVYEVKGKDLVITSKSGQGGSVVLKNYAAKDTGAMVYVDGKAINETQEFKDMLKYNATDFTKGKFTGTFWDETINAGAYISTSVKGVTINSGAGNDKITGSKFNDTIKASAGNNEIHEYSGVNKITTGKGDDKIYLEAGYSSNTVKSTGGDNLVEIRNSGVNKITLGAGNDDIRIYDGVNTINAGSSITTKEIQKIQELQGEGKIEDYPIFPQSFSVRGGINTITGGKGLDFFEIYDGYNTINSGADCDQFEIKGGTNNINGGAGDDSFNIYGGYSNNFIQGGAGNDVYTFRELKGEVPAVTNTVINDSKGNDVYNINLGNIDVNITDKAGNDMYSVKYLTSNVVITDTKGNDTLTIKEDVSNMSLFFNVDAKKGAVGNLNIVNTIDSSFGSVEDIDLNSGVHITNYFTKNGKVETVKAINNAYGHDEPKCELDIDTWVDYIKSNVQSWLEKNDYKNTMAVFDSGNQGKIAELMACYTTTYNDAVTDVGNTSDPF